MSQQPDGTFPGSYFRSHGRTSPTDSGRRFGRSGPWRRAGSVLWLPPLGEQHQQVLDPLELHPRQLLARLAFDMLELVQRARQVSVGEQ